jgi:hypothetical protein
VPGSAAGAAQALWVGKKRGEPCALDSAQGGRGHFRAERLMIRSILAVFAGLMIFLITVTVLQGMMVVAYPLPPGIDPNDAEALKQALIGMPAGAFGVLLAAYAVGAMCGGAVAAAIAGSKRVTHAAVVGGVATLAGIANFATLPHPAWVVIVGVPMFMVMAVAGGLLGQRLTR